LYGIRHCFGARARMHLWNKLRLFVFFLFLLSVARSAAGAVTFVAATTYTSGNANSSTATLDYSVSIQARDVLLIQVTTRANSTITTPSGWTLISRVNNGTNNTQAIYFRVATGSESGSQTVSLSAGARMNAVMYVYRGVNPKSPILVSGNNTGTSTSGNTVTANAVTVPAGNDDAMLLTFFGVRHGGTPTGITPPTGMTERAQVMITSGTRLITQGSSEQLSASGSTGTRAAVYAPNDNSETYVAHMVVLRAARTYYSYQTGNWGTANTWTTDATGATLVGSAVPADLDSAIVLNGRTVSLTANVTTANLGLTVQAGGTVDLVTYNFSDLFCLSGGGSMLTLKRASPAFPAVSAVNSFSGTYNIYPVKTLVTYQSGNWNTANTWTTDLSGLTLTGAAVPGDYDSAVVLSGKSVIFTANVTQSGLSFNITAGGSVDLTDYTITGLDHLTGSGELRILVRTNPVYFPVITNNSFSPGPGTLIYYKNTLYSYQSGNWTEPNSWTKDPSGTTLVSPAVPGNFDSVVVLNGRIITAIANITNTNMGLLLQAGGTLNLQNFTITNALTALAGGGVLRINASGTAYFPTTAAATFNQTNGGTLEYYSTGGGTITLPSGPFNNLTLNKETSGSVLYVLAANLSVNGSLTVSRTGSATVDFRIGNSAVTRTLNITGHLSLAAGCTLSVHTAGTHQINLSGDLVNNGRVRLTNQTSPDYLITYTGGYAVLTFTGSGNAKMDCFGITDLYRLVLDKGVDQTFLLTINSSNTANFRLMGENDVSNTPAQTTTDPNPVVNKALSLKNGTLRLKENINIPSMTEGGDDIWIPLNTCLWVDGATVSTTTSDNGTGYQALTISGRFRITAGTFTTNNAAGLIYIGDGIIDIEGGTTTVCQMWNIGTGRTTFRQTGGTCILNATGEPNDGQPVFKLESVDASFTMTGGLLQVSNPRSVANGGLDINVSTLNANVTGGTVEFITTGTNTFNFRSTAPFYNLIVNRTGGAGITSQNTQPLTILNNLTISGSQTLLANNLNLTVGGNFTIGSGSTYTPGTNTVTFNGNGKQTFSNSGTITTAFNNLTINKADTLLLAGTSNTWIVANTFVHTAGILNDGGKTLELRAACTFSGTHIGSGKIQLSTANSRTLSGNGSGALTNLELTGAAANVVYTLGANLKIMGNLGFITSAANDRILDIGSYNLLLDTFATITNPSADRFIRTSGFQSAAGLTKVMNSNSFLFPVGTGATDYTPGSLALDATPTQYGSVTVRPVAFSHPSVTETGRSLNYYWKTTSSNFVLGSAKVTWVYTYAEADVVAGGDVSEAGYVAARYDVSNNSWVPGITANLNTTSNVITFGGAVFESSISGEYTAGDNSPTNPFGTVTVYYSYASGPWTSLSTWSTAGHTGTQVQPLAIPNANSIVRIGNGIVNHTITVTANNALSGSLVIGNGSVLDVGAFTGHNFGAIAGETVAGNGTLRVSRTTAGTMEFPAGDFGEFLGANGGEVVFYNNGANALTIPAISAAPTSLNLGQYRNLTFEINSTGNLLMPATALTILDTMRVRGSGSGVVLSNTTAATDITIHSDLRIDARTLRLQHTTASKTITVKGDIVIASGGALDNTGAGAIIHILNLEGSIVNNGRFDLRNDNSNYTRLNFIGSGMDTVGGSNTAGAEIYVIEVNKGSDCSAGIVVNMANAITTQANTGWLNLTNGRFEWANSSSLTASNTNVAFEIPTTTCLILNNASATLGFGQFNGDDADVSLRGKLELKAGTINVGNLANNTNNDIEIAPAGLPVLEISGGTLQVNGQIRRSLTSTAGSLYYLQGGNSIVNILGRNHNTSRGKLEVVNSGAYFQMEGTSLLTVQTGGAVTFADLYVRPDSSLVTGGTVRLIPRTVGGSEVFTFDVTYSFYNLEILRNGGSGTSTVGLFVNNLTVNNNFTLGDGGIINTNNLNVRVGGNVSKSAVGSASYNGGNSSFTMFGTSAELSGDFTTQSFYQFIVDNNAVVTLQASSPIRATNSLTIHSGGTLHDNGNAVQLRGNATNNGTHTSPSASSTNTLVFDGTGLQQISGTGTFGNLVINNVDNVQLNNSTTVTRQLTLSAGLIDIGANRLTLGATATVSGSFSSVRMIRSNGVLSDGGVTKSYNTSGSFLYPIGVLGKYTPATINITALSNPGTVNIRVVNQKHPSTRDAAESQLNYYWQIDSTGFSGGVTATHTYNYIQGDVNGTETNYRGGRYEFPNWSPLLGIAGAVNSAANTITLTGVSYIGGGITAGESSEFTAVSTYYSRDAVCPGGCDWTNANSWSTGGHAGSATGVPPLGVPVIIATGHTVNITANTQLAESTQLNGTAILNLNQTFAHNLGIVSGTGTIRIRATGSEQFVFPGGNYDAFTAANGGTVEFYNAGNGILPTQTTYNKIIFKDGSTRTQANVDWIINGDLTIEAGNITNITFNRNWEVRANWINQVGVAGFVPGSGTVNFKSASPQLISGVTTFYNLEVAGGGSKTLQSDITVLNTLTMTHGRVYLGTYNLVMDSVANVNGTPSAIAMVVQGSSGRVRKNIRSNSGSFTFPIGEETGTAEYAPTTILFSSGTFGSGAYVTVQVIDDQNPTCSGGTNYISRYWAYSSNAVTDYVVNLSARYTDADVNGSEALIFSRMTRPSLPCLNGLAADAAGNSLSITGISVLNEFSAGEAPFAEPTIQATLLVFENVTSTTMRLRWTKGNGSRRLVLARAGNVVNSNPVDNTVYTADTVFAAGSQLGAGNYAVYANNDSTFLLTGLTPETTYHFAVYEFSNAGIDVDFLLTLPATGSQTTWAVEPTVQSTVLTFSAIGTSSLKLKWTNGNGSRRLVLGKAVSAVDVLPEDGQGYTSSAVFGSGQQVGTGNYVLFNSTIDSVIITGMDQNTVYHFSVFEFNGTGGVQNYLVTSPATGNQHTYLLANVQLWLEGGWNGSNMDALMLDSLPLTQPYNTAPWNYAGTENVASLPNANIVDWVLLELRKSGSAATATSGTIKATQVGFMLRNGNIVGLDGSADLQFNTSEAGDFYVAVYHRTHIPVMSASQLVFSAGAYRYNFKTAVSQAYGTDALTDLGGGSFGAYAGRVENTTPYLIDAADRTAGWNDRNNFGYRSTNATLKGDIDAADRSVIWNNRGKTSQIP